MGLVLVLIAFVSAFWGATRSVGAGMVVVLASGYFYAFLRANFLDIFAFFIFDAAALGIYLGHLVRTGTFWPTGSSAMSQWALVLIGWPFLVFALGFMYPQHVLIQFVGLRAAVWFLPFLFLGTWARHGDLQLIARALAVLNGVALLFAIGEYFLGLEAFFPHNGVTELMYRSSDVGGEGALRVPATFGHAALYGGTMVASLPWLLGGWLSAGGRFGDQVLMLSAVAAAAVGTFICGSRSPVVVLLIMALVVAYHFRARVQYLGAIALMAVAIGYLVSSDERLQRFSTLGNTGMVGERLVGSANLGVLELMLTYPMGTGLGSAYGTNIPSFLAHLVSGPPVGAENEFARIGLEQSMVGALLWVAFIVWLLARRRVLLRKGWQTADRLMTIYIALSWSCALLGCGTLASIPTTPMLLFMMGVLGGLPNRAAESTPEKASRTAMPVSLRGHGSEVV